MKMRLPETLLVAAMVFLPALALAAGPSLGADGATGAGMVESSGRLTPEQIDAADAVLAIHGERLYRLDEAIWAKTTELRELSAAHKAGKGDIEELVARIDALRSDLRQEREAVQAELAAAGVGDFSFQYRNLCDDHVRSVNRLG